MVRSMSDHEVPADGRERLWPSLGIPFLPDDPDDLRELILLARIWVRTERTDDHWFWRGKMHRIGREQREWAVLMTRKPRGSAGHDRSSAYVHRFLWKHFQGLPKHVMLRKVCDEPLCVRPHLDHWRPTATGQAKNVASSTIAFNETLAMSEQRNDLIRAAYATGRFTLLDLGTLFGVSRQRIEQIVQGGVELTEAP